MVRPFINYEDLLKFYKLVQYNFLKKEAIRLGAIYREEPSPLTHQGYEYRLLSGKIIKGFNKDELARLCLPDKKGSSLYDIHGIPDPLLEGVDVKGNKHLIFTTEQAVKVIAHAIRNYYQKDQKHYDYYDYILGITSI